MTADSEKQEAFNAVLEMVELLQHTATEEDDAPRNAKKRKSMMTLKVREVSKSVMSMIVDHCNSLGAGLPLSLSLVLFLGLERSCV